jgi:probable phosphoglycerate mutase
LDVVDDDIDRREGSYVAVTEIVLVRHGATEWSAQGRHTGRTDVPLSPQGRIEADALRDRLTGWSFALVLTSPLSRARATAERCGLGDRAVIDPDLRELDYGDDEGRTTAEIRQERPGWTVWSGSPNGESLTAAAARMDRVLARIAEVNGPVALFGHGHSLRILIARWLGLPAVDGRCFALDTATLSVLGYEHDLPVVQRLNI